MLNNKVSKAVRLAIAFGAVSTAAFSSSSFAAEEESAEKVERIQVTGSRIKRTDLEGASPVVSITSADIKLEGDYTVADALRSSSLNSFGSFSERSGSSAQSQATINLRGAGSRRTLVLLNGRRFPGSPTLGGASANLNAIPMAAVERIDIMTEGASSIYGSDAMAGVVNVIMKENFEGLTFNIGAGHRDQDEGTTSTEFSVVGGVSNDKGNITFSFDHQSRKGISDADRDYTKAQLGDLDGDGDIEAYTADTVGWSYFGATVLSPDFSTASASLLCDDLISEYGEDTFRRVDANEDWGPGSEYCMYAFANVSYNTASIDRNTLYVSANYELTDDIEFFAQTMFVQNSSFGRYAPPAAAWENMAADNPHNPYGEDGAYGLFRWVGIGTRDGNVDDYNQDLTAGLRGDLDWNNASWEVYYHHNKADNKSVGEYYLSYSGLAYNEANDIDLGSDEGIANMKSTTLQNSGSTFDQYFAGLGFDLFELPGGAVAHYVGVEYFEQTYEDIYDGQSEAGLIGGSAGNSSMGDRDVTAVFFESVLPVSDTVEVNLKARYDDYSDFGDNVAPAVSARWQVADNVVIRGSYSESFRAPGLDLLNAARTFSAESAIDYNNGSTTSRQYNTYYTQNSELEAETSDYINLGVAWDVNDNLSFKLDYFQLSIDNVIQSKSLQGLLSDEAAGLITAVGVDTDTSDETFYLKRSASGTLIEAGTSYFNGAGFEIEGFDFTINANVETDFGDFRFNNVNSVTLSYDSEVGGVVQDTAGWSGQPDLKSVATISWSLDDHTVSWNSTYTASTSETEVDEDGDGFYEQSGDLDSWLIHNLTYSYNAGPYGAVTFTVSNLTDEDPVLSSAGTWDNQDLYNNFGRDYRVNYSISF
ncbi:MULTISPECIES: TonB-dependent receptor domain-containing protein [Pseudoalteromonas]|jgi:iron complex outermembrane receptor protein|uniref:TonB-dependent receptor n=1 Tax=Pseudoalteromonas agarivorans TaxID=176102 RepID=A0ABR5VPY7_9GAMM|nr:MULTISPECIES: TonB-dependent receptor [Pseudoalteromonas]KYL31699.1 TonB-dependent receptor [Pseudoalteromonas telluritireducens]MCK8095555.1 TonB-dependent receptor [Pseudoalteromonas sp. 1CM17D]MCK8132254.1 TonB-dependent receptor [Pseudoalteromonas sp. 2CM28B]MDC9507994.1 TonB-dependent receptor [Pseudoalteromonas sp. Angola-4]MDC9525248.1 TonB-dependent receptor [Pseudoalteromonas sp. Angola-30]|tara:strand:+ start:21811 stop:24432 length:2622 start_codon:yes stop_codon:yes gene_type:complete